MLEQSLKETIKVYLQPDYIKVVENECALWEKKEPGRTKLNVHLPRATPILCICDHDNKPRCAFLNCSSEYGLQTSVDHILLIPNSSNAWDAHLIEMKSGVGKSEWQKISRKTRATMLNMKALAAVIGITIDSFHVYTTYERLSYHQSDQTDMASRKPMLGGDWKELEWDKDKLSIDTPQGTKEYLVHHGVKMVIEPVDGKPTLCGELTLL